MSDPVNPYMQQGPADQGPYGQAPHVKSRVLWRLV